MNSEESGKAVAPAPEGLSGLQFDRAEPVHASGAASCPICGASIGEQYYLLNGHTICATCGSANALGNLQEPSKADLARAILYGSGAALAGTIAYFAILALTGYEIGLIAVAVGWVVGRAVHKGGRGLGGRKLQVIAVLLTYFSIVGSNIPLMIKYAIDNPPKQRQSKDKRDNGKQEASRAEAGSAEERSGSSGRETKRLSLGGFLIGILILLAYCLAMPFLQGFSNIVGLFIIFIGLYEAWKWNRRPQLTLEGPFSATPAVAGS